MIGGGCCDDEDDDENAGGDVVDSGCRYDAASLAKVGKKTRAQDVMISTDQGLRGKWSFCANFLI